ncbi:MAG: hypothetical protein JXA42_24660, partial [Anaerolineales bacterium]|nr:hypothetical protein [Anaerolineales bacterium]
MDMRQLEEIIPHVRQEQRAQSRLFRMSRKTRDAIAGRSMGLLTISVVLLVPIIILALYLRAKPILATQSLQELLLSTTWRPLKGAFGFFPFIMGTLWVTVVSMVIAVPPSLLTAIYLAEYARPKTRAIVMPLIDLLAGIPSVVYGVWGMLTVVPFIDKVAAP